MKSTLKFVIFLSMGVFALFAFTGCGDDELLPGSISGIVTDKATGEPIRSTGVELSPSGARAVTGDDGYYVFSNVEPGEYTLSVVKTGYEPYVSNVIKVVSGEDMPHNIQLTLEPPSLRIVDDSKNDISELDFGSSPDDNTRMFNIFNDGESTIQWNVTTTVDWIKDVSRKEGELAPGKIQAVIVQIDRSLLVSGENITTIHVTSNNGSHQLKVKATNSKSETVLNTLKVSDIKSTSAVLNGEVVNEGNPKYTELGFVCSESENPTVESTSKITTSLSSGSRFSYKLSNLEAEKSYYVRTFCVQNDVVIYGNSVSFTTSQQEAVVNTSAATAVTATSATFNASVLQVGVPAYTERGFVYSKSGEPTISDNRRVVGGTGTGDYSLQVSGLEFPTTYYVRAYVVQANNIILGNTVSFTTVHGAAAVTTSAATSVSATSATLNASVADAGSPEYTERGFCYSLYSNPSINDNRIRVSGSGTGNYSYVLNNLDYPETYYVCAYLIQSGEPVYGNTVSFSTMFDEASVTTSSVTKIETNSARFNGTITNVGVPACTERGFCYSSTNRNPTISDSKVVKYYAPYGSYYEDIKNLTPATTYYVRAFVVQDGEEIYGNVVSFTTSSLPVVMTLNVSNLRQVEVISGFMYEWSVQFNGAVVDAGNPSFTKKGFAYRSGTSSEEKVTVYGSGIGNYSYTLTGLVDQWMYSVRAFVQVGSQYYYGESVQFDTY